MCLTPDILASLFNAFFLVHDSENPELGSLNSRARSQYIDAGETLHSFRAGRVLTLTLSGSQLSDVMSHVGWSSPRTASYYLQLANVLKAGAPAEHLAAGLSDLRDAQQLYTDYNTLRDFVTAFPSPFLSNPNQSSTS